MENDEVKKRPTRKRSKMARYQPYDYRPKERKGKKHSGKDERSPEQSTNTQSTTVTLTIKRSARTSVSVVGKSSEQYCNHAEMNAFHKFIWKHCNKCCSEALNRINGAKKKTVSCTAKPICVACSAVLQDFGFEPEGFATKWSEEKSGGVSWGLSIKMKEFIKLAHASDPEKIKDLDTYLKLGEK